MRVYHGESGITWGGFLVGTYGCFELGKGGGKGKGKVDLGGEGGREGGGGEGSSPGRFQENYM